MIPQRAVLGALVVWMALLACQEPAPEVADSPTFPDRCLAYEPDTVTLSGTLQRHEFPGPPNFASVDAGDEAQVGLYLHLPQPVCTSGDSSAVDAYPQARADTIQLVLDPGGGVRLDPLVGSEVTLSGTLYARHSGHHHAPLLMEVIESVPVARQEQRPTPDSWTDHPEIVKIRELYNEVEMAAEAGDYTVSSKSAKCYGRVWLDVRLYTDSSGTVRRYRVEGGTDDSAGEVTYYYDRSGILRFTFESLRTVNGSHRETRKYFDETGKALYTDKRLLEGPGWAGGFQLAVVDPKADFADLCADG